MIFSVSLHRNYKSIKINIKWQYFKKYQLKKFINFRELCFVFFAFFIEDGQLFSRRKFIILSVLFLYFNYCFYASFFFIKFLILIYSSSFFVPVILDECADAGVHIFKFNFYLSRKLFLSSTSVRANIELFFFIFMGSVEDIAHNVFILGFCSLVSFLSGEGSDSSRSRSLLRLCRLFYELFLFWSCPFYLIWKKFFNVVLTLFSWILLESFRMLLWR